MELGRYNVTDPQVYNKLVSGSGLNIDQIHIKTVYSSTSVVQELDLDSGAGEHVSLSNSTLQTLESEGIIQKI